MDGKHIKTDLFEHGRIRRISARDFPGRDSSNKNTKRPVIFAFLNSSGAVWTAGPKFFSLSVLGNEVNNQTAFFNKSKEENIGEGPAQTRNAP